MLDQEAQPAVPRPSFRRLLVAINSVRRGLRLFMAGTRR